MKMSNYDWLSKANTYLVIGYARTNKTAIFVKL